MYLSSVSYGLHVGGVWGSKRGELGAFFGWYVKPEGSWMVLEYHKPSGSHNPRAPGCILGFVILGFRVPFKEPFGGYRISFRNGAIWGYVEVHFYNLTSTTEHPSSIEGGLRALIRGRASYYRLNHNMGTHIV